MWINKKNLAAIKTEAFNAGKKDLEDKNAALRENYSKAIEERNKAQLELTKLKNQLREQSEADMVLAAIKLIMATANGKSKEDISPIYNLMLSAQQQARAMGNSPLYSLIGNAFGRY